MVSDKQHAESVKVVTALAKAGDTIEHWKSRALSAESELSRLRAQPSEQPVGDGATAGSPGLYACKQCKREFYTFPGCEQFECQWKTEHTTGYAPESPLWPEDKPAAPPAQQQEVEEIRKRHRERQASYDYAKESSGEPLSACGPQYHQDIATLLRALDARPRWDRESIARWYRDYSGGGCSTPGSLEFADAIISAFVGTEGRDGK